MTQIHLPVIVICFKSFILGNPGVTHSVTLNSSPLGQLARKPSFLMNIHIK